MERAEGTQSTNWTAAKAESKQWKTGYFTDTQVLYLQKSNKKVI